MTPPIWPGCAKQWRRWRPSPTGHRYLNFAGFQEEGDTMMRGAFGPHYARLQTIKRRYDPENVFRLNQNIAANAS